MWPIIPMPHQVLLHRLYCMIDGHRFAFGTRAILYYNGCLVWAYTEGTTSSMLIGAVTDCS